MVEFSEVITDLTTSYPDALAAVVVDGANNQIVYTTDNWDIGDDIGKVMSVWISGRGQFVNVQGVKYSILQNSPERFISTNFGKQGHLIGASTPKQEYYIVAFISPDAEGWSQAAYPTLARAAGMLVGGVSISEASVMEMGGGAPNAESMGGPPPEAAAPSIDPELKAEIDGFLSWIKDPQGLPGYIEYYLNQNDATVIAKMAGVYNEFRRIFNF